MMTDIQKKRFSETWIPVIMQTAVLLMAIAGLAISTEHRLTIIEECSRTNTQTINDTVSSVRQIQSNQIRILTLVDDMEKRHEREDREEARLAREARGSR